MATTSSERCTADTQSEEDVDQREMVADTLPPAADTVLDEEECPAIKSPKHSFKKGKKNNLDGAMINMCQRLPAKTPTSQTSSEKRRILVLEIKLNESPSFEYNLVVQSIEICCRCHSTAATAFE